MKDIDRGWLAGILEGEGSFGLYTSKGGKGSTSLIWRIQISMADKDIIERVQALIGGRLYSYPSKSPKHSTMWKLHITKRHEVIAVLLLVRDLMGERRGKKFDEMIEASNSFQDKRGHNLKKLV